MQDSRYFGTYLRFMTVSKKAAASLISADGIIGNELHIDMRRDDGQTTMWLVNKWGSDVGYFEEEEARQVQLMLGHGFVLHPLLALVAITEAETGGFYWGETAIIASEPQFEQDISNYVKRVGRLLKNGVRPDIDLSSASIDKMIAAHGKWEPSSRTPLPKLAQDTVIVKSRITLSERFVEAGRAKKPWVMAIGIIFNIAVVVGVIALIVKLFF